MSANLFFNRRLATAGNPADLLFRAGTDIFNGSKIQADITLPSDEIDSSLAGRTLYHLVSDVLLPDDECEGLIAYDNAVHRGLTSSTKSLWGEAIKVKFSTDITIAKSKKLQAATLAVWNQTSSRRSSMAALWHENLRFRAGFKTKWFTTKHVLASSRIPYRELSRRARPTLTTHWGEARKLSSNSIRTYWTEYSRHARPTIRTSWRKVTPRLQSHQFRWAGRGKTNGSLNVPWGEAHRPYPGVTLVIYPPEPPTKEPCYTPDPKLLFQYSWTGDGNLLFICKKVDSGTIYIPVRKVYIVVNTVSLKRVDDGTLIDLNSTSIGIDNNSWCWAFSASIPFDQLDKVAPTDLGPVEVELDINGIKWRVLVEEFDRRLEFGKTSINIKGRSLTAYLDAPYAPVRSFIQTDNIWSRQMAENELERPGLTTGFTLDWNLIGDLGWMMPANTWSYTDLTPIQVMQQITQGAGGFINSHPLNRELIVQPEYPFVPWEWDDATADISLPRDIIKSESLRWTEKPLYNAVFVSGENTGVTALVKREGTAGDFQAPMFISPMISASDAARNKGKTILASGGKQAEMNIDLPMEPTIGLITPGMLIEVTGPNWRGLVRSAAITASWDRALTITQSVGIERHYGGL